MSAVSTTVGPSSRRVALGLAVIYLAWGAAFPSMKVVVETVPPWVASATRFSLAGALLLGVVALCGGLGRLRLTGRELASCALVGVLLMTMTQGSMGVALKWGVPAGTAALVAASAPLWVVVLRRLGRESVSGATQAGVGLGFLGVAWLMLPSSRAEVAPVGGIMLVAGAAVAWALGSYAQKRLSMPADPFVGAGVQLLAGGLGASMIAGLTGESSSFTLEHVTLEAAVGLAYLIVVGSIVALVTLNWLLRHASISKVATHAYVNPVVAVALASVLLGERLSPQTLAAATVIVASVAIVIRFDQPAAAGQRRLSAASTPARA